MDVNAAVLILVKATVLLGLAFIAVRWERTSPAIRRHGVWSVTFVALLALPLLALILPGIHVPLPGWGVASATKPEPAVQPIPIAGSNAPPATQSPVTSHESRVLEKNAESLVTTQESSVTISAPDIRTLLVTLWLVGVVTALLGLLRSLIRVRQLASSGTPVDDREWRHAAVVIAKRLGLRVTPDLVFSTAVATPMAGNFARPVVFLPTDAPHWDTDRRDVVLTHELTHLVRRDPLRILAARVACALYWFHPLMWIAARRSTADCELACDENVLALGVRPSTYARVLLDFANSPTPVLSAALPIVHRHRLETRVMAILSNSDSAYQRAAGPRRTFITTVVAVGMILMVAAIRPGAIRAEAGANVATLPAVIVAPAVKAPEVIVPPVVREPGAAPESQLVTQDASCWSMSTRTRGGFSGSSQVEGSRIIQRVGRLGRERVALMTFEDLRVCLITEGFDGSDDSEPSDWIGRADRIVLETERGNNVRRLDLDGRLSTFTINGRVVSLGDDVVAWRRAALDLLDASWEASNIRGQESSLRGEISSVMGERSSLLGEISSLRGEVSSMRGEISSLRGEESSMRGEISSIRGHESSLRGQISSHRGEISSLEAYRWERYADRAAIDARITRHRESIRAIEDEIARYDADGRVREMERRLASFDVDGKVAAVERQIRNFDVEGKVAEVERRIAGLNVDREVRSIEGEIRGLNADSRVRDILARRDVALDRLRSILRER
jgi:beta-lactamase regulating signal transducer with metallopeptidase domain